MFHSHTSQTLMCTRITWEILLKCRFWFSGSGFQDCISKLLPQDVDSPIGYRDHTWE